MKKVITLCAILCSLDTFAQTPPPDAPNVQWRSMDWPQRDRHGFFQTREQSGEDWWYSHENKYDEYNNHVGYIAVGYSTFINDYLDSQNECWNRQQNCPNCRDFEGPNFKKGDDWGWIGEYELSGKMKWCKTYVHGHLQKMVIDED